MTTNGPVLRTMGVDISTNHASETQVTGTKRRLTEIADLFTNSPFAKDAGVTFSSADFAKKLVGTSGDHAADQLKMHDMLGKWKTEEVERDLGIEVMVEMEPTDAFAALTQAASTKVLQLRNEGRWDSLSADERKEVMDSAADEFKRSLG
jgi:hypothetical protein